MNPKIKDIAVRTLSGVVLLAVMLGAIIGSRGSYTVLLLAITAGVTWEHLRLSEACGARPQKVAAMIISLLVPLLGISACTVEAVGVAAVVAVFMVPVFELFRNRENPMQNVGATLLPALQVGLPMLLLGKLPDCYGEPDKWIVVAYFAIVWANDIFAFLVGISFGRHRLCERISPKKSWEGFFGGVVAAICVGALSGCLLERNIAVWAGLGLVAALSGVAGDLIESMFKRAAGVKDSGAIMPGHGGWFDRFDAVLMSAPFVFIYMYLIV